MDGAGSWWLEPSPGELYPRLPQLPSTMDGFEFRSNGSSAYLNNLKFQASKSIRTSFVILASFNALAGAAIAVGIYWDCYMNTRRNDPNFRFRSSFWKVLGPAEIFPFIISSSMIVQSITFAVIQSFGLQSSLILGCAPLSQMMLPTFLMIPYIQFTFAVEAIFQAVRPNNPFSPRHKWSVQACLTIPMLGAVGSYVLARFVLPPNFCFASLVFYLRRWGLGIFGILVGIASTLLLGSAITFYRLYQVSGIGEQQRITASWMAWFMALGCLSMSLTAPFFFSVSADDGSKVSTMQSKLSMVVVVVVNLNGILTGALYVLLRSSKLGKIGPRGYHEFDSHRSVRRQVRTKLHSFVFTKQMEQPVPMPAKLPEHRASSYYPPDNEATPVTVSPGPKTGPATSPSAIGVAMGNNNNTLIFEQQRLARKKSYNFFPRDIEPDSKSVYMLQATAYAPSSKDVVVDNPFADEIPPPPTLRFSGGKHNRDSSLGSTATVPIGLRVSYIDDMPPVQSFYQIPPAPAPDRLTKPESKVPVSAIPTTLIIPDADTEDGEDKQLPPVPLAFSRSEIAAEEPQEELRLSPKVYSPQKVVPKSKQKLSSPGSSPPPRLNWTSDNQPSVKDAGWI